jgi:hypothetical protein
MTLMPLNAFIIGSDLCGELKPETRIIESSRTARADISIWQGRRKVGSNISDANLVYAYAAAQTMVQVLKQSGDNLTRENVIKQAASLKDFAPDMLLPGIKINTSASDFAPIEQRKMMQFKGGKWDLFGDIISAETGG